MLEKAENFKTLKEELLEKPYTQCFILTDNNTQKYCLPFLDGLFKQMKRNYINISIPAGEENKNLESCTFLWSELSKAKADRAALIINLGGGMISDLGGFVASTYKRGISFFNLPTTLLAMVDASIGGKCGIDFQFYKNQIGLFRAADDCFVFPDFLKTLPEKEMKSGFAEVIKHALINNRDYFEKVEKLRSISYESCKDLIEQSRQIKMDIVAADPLEKGERKKLNFGHTIGHAIESYFLELKKPIPHGYAIAVGMICESFVSKEMDLLTAEEFALIQQLIQKFYTKVGFDELAMSRILELLAQDKKSEKGQSKFTLLTSIGEAVIDQYVAKSTVQKSLKYYCSL